LKSFAFLAEMEESSFSNSFGVFGLPRPNTMKEYLSQNCKPHFSNFGPTQLVVTGGPNSKQAYTPKNHQQ
jgi:hypothetical protein